MILGKLLFASISPVHEDSVSNYSTSAEVKRGFPGGSVLNNSTANARDDRDFGLILGQEDPMEEGMTSQYSCLENPVDRGAWKAVVHGVTKSQTPLID